MERALGVVDLVHDGVDSVTRLAEDTHRSIAAQPARVMERAIPVVGRRWAEVAREVTALTTGLAGLVYSSVRGVNRAVRGASWVAGTAVRPLPATVPSSPPLVPLRSDAIRSPLCWADAGIGLLNGIVGDHLRDRRNALDAGMWLRHEDRVLDPDRHADSLSGDVCVFVHGLATTEWSWSVGAETHRGDAGATFGEQLRDELGITPLYARYNSGRRVPENGRLLADLLERLRPGRGGPERVVLVGHSMGGLVARSAVHYGLERDHDWTDALDHVVCLGAPHGGVPLGRLADRVGSSLADLDLPGLEIPLRLLGLRSAGIRDLGWGSVRDEDGPDGAPDDDRPAPPSIPFAEGIPYTLVAATLTRRTDHPLARIVGDALVRESSALAHDLDEGPDRDVRRVTLGGVSHLGMVGHPDVYEVLREAFERTDRASGARS